MTLGVLSRQASFPPSPKAGAHVEDPVEVGMLRHPRPEQRGPHQLEAAARGLGHNPTLGRGPGKQALRAVLLALTRLSFAPGLLFAGKWSQQEQKKLGEKSLKLDTFLPLAVAATPCSHSPTPSDLGGRKPKMLCLDFCGGKPWPSSWNTSEQKNWQSWGFFLP